MSETNPEHDLLINNKERKQYEKQENDNLHQENTSPHNHDIRIWEQNAFVFIQKVTYSLLNILQQMVIFPYHPSLPV